jgi:hypothetical protein
MPLSYTVQATVPAAFVSKYMHWLIHDHIAKLVDAGALAAEVRLLDAPPAPNSTTPPTPPAPPATRLVEAHYTFASREALEGYITNHAPRLRAEGLAAFPPDLGITFTRTVAEIHGRVPALEA